MNNILSQNHTLKSTTHKQSFAFVSVILFLFSPFLSIPFILADIYNRRKGALFCFSMFGGVLTYLLLPSWDLDLSRYYSDFEYIATCDLEAFIELLENRADYLFYCLFFVFSRFELKFQILLFCLSTFNFYVVFFVFDKISSHFRISKNDYFLNFILLTLSIGILYYISATRFTLGCSFFILYVYNFYFRKNSVRSYVFFAIACITHTAFLLYIPIIVIISQINNRKLLLVVTLFFLLIGFIIPPEFVLPKLSSYLPAFADKALVYLADHRVRSTTLTLSINLSIVIAVFFLIKFYSILPTKLLNLFLVILLPVLITYPIGFEVYGRYMMILNFVFAIILIVFPYYVALNKKPSYIFVRRFMYVPFLLYYAYTLYLYRFSMAAYFSLDNVLLFNILSKEYTTMDFLAL